MKRKEADVTHPDEAQLDAYLDGELAGDDAREIEAHLAHCPECARFRDGRLALRAGIAAHCPRNGVHAMNVKNHGVRQ